MKLFPEDPKINLLPYNGEVNYYGEILTFQKADHYYEQFLNTIEWRNDEAIIFGKRIVTARKVAWYGNKKFPYKYSGTTKYALPWTAELLELKECVEKETGETFNSCLLNLYHSGKEGMAWHSDGETALLKNGAIASLSFGAERKFAFKYKNRVGVANTKENIKPETISINLAHGSLLVMKGVTQSYWLHKLPTTKKVLTPRINLTFRTITQ